MTTQSPIFCRKRSLAHSGGPWRFLTIAAIDFPSDATDCGLYEESSDRTRRNSARESGLAFRRLGAAARLYASILRHPDPYPWGTAGDGRRDDRQRAGDRVPARQIADRERHNDLSLLSGGRACRRVFCFGRTPPAFARHFGGMRHTTPDRDCDPRSLRAWLAKPRTSSPLNLAFEIGQEPHWAILRGLRVGPAADWPAGVISSAETFDDPDDFSSALRGGGGAGRAR